MPQRFKPLSSLAHDATPITITPYQIPELVHLEDPALDIMIDYDRVPAPTISPDTTLDEALNVVHLGHRYTLLVLDSLSQLVGVINATYLLSSQPIRFIADNGLERSQVTASMLMTPVEKIIQLDYGTLKQAQVGHVVATLISAQSNYAVVVEQKSETEKTIRGVYSLPIIDKHTQENLKIKPWAKRMSSVASMQHEEIG